MLAAKFINSEITALRPSDTVETALNWMAELKTKQLPVVESRKLLGILSESNLLAVADDRTTIGQLPLDKKDLFVYGEQRIYEFLHYFRAYGLSIIPVLNQGGHYQGVIGASDMMGYFAEAFSTEMGGIIMLEMDYRDYSLSEISRLVESNKARIIGSLVEIDPDNQNRLLLTLKLNTSDIRYVVATLERFGYKLLAQLKWQEEAVSIESERLGSLMRYLDV